MTVTIPDSLADEFATQFAAEAIAPHDTDPSWKRFCELWPSARQVLELLKTIIPGGALVIGLVITIGDGAAKAFCGD